jgi:branched-chain amino acid transport system permease protein
MEDIFLSIGISTLVSGSVYALVAAGLSLVWGTLGVFNFAQGAVLMIGAYSTLYLGGAIWGRPGLLIAIPASLLLTGCFGILVYLVAVKPFIGLPTGEMSTIMATLAVGVFIENSVLQFLGARFRQIPELVTGSVVLNFNPITWQQILMMVASPVILIASMIILKQTKVGIAVRAVAQNQDSALLLGIPVKRIYILVFFISSIYACLAGILFGGQYFVSPDMGGTLMLQAFIVVVLGGLGNLYGTILASYLVGLISSVSNYYIGLFWTPAVLFATLFIIVLIRPAGLLAKKT